MEKYSEIIEAMRTCAGPDCNDGCPYYGKTAGAKTCRALLLEDGMKAIVDAESRANTAEIEAGNLCADVASLGDDVHDLEKKVDSLTEERDKLKALNTALEKDVSNTRAHRDAIAEEYNAMTAENATLRERCQVQQNEINALLQKGVQPSASSAAPGREYDRGYTNGYGEALQWCYRRLCEECFGGRRHE